MNKIIKEKQKDIEVLCQKFHVQELEVFGSVTHQGFDPSLSDIDFLVEFNPLGIANYADNYFGLLGALETLFDKPVELVVKSSISNPYFLESIERDRAFLYAA